MSETPTLLAVRPVRVWGGGHVVSLTPEVREALGAKKGDQITFRKVGRYVFIAVLRASTAIPISDNEFKEARAALGG